MVAKQHGLPRVMSPTPPPMDRIYAIADKRPRYLHPLSETFTWRDLARAKLTAYGGCDPRISLDCQKRRRSAQRTGPLPARATRMRNGSAKD